MKQLRWKAAAVRGGRFYVVGALGMVVQLSLLAILLHGCHLGCIAATAVAVELTVLHNFYWHERFTWADRPTGASRDMCVRLIRFNLSTGAVSVAGNLLFTDFLVGQICTSSSCSGAWLHCDAQDGGSRLSGKGRPHLHKREARDQYPPIGLLKDCVHLRCPHLAVVSLGERAGIEEIDRQSEALLAFCDNRVGPGTRVNGGNLADLFQRWHFALRRDFSFRSFQ